MNHRTTTKIALLATVAAVLAFSNSKAIDLLSLGTSGFTVDGSSGSYSQTTTALSFGSVLLGGTVFGPVVGGPLDLTAPAYGIRMTVSSEFDPLTFRLTLYDSTYTGGGTGFADYEGNTGSLTVGVEGIVTLSLTNGSVNPASIIALGITWDEGGNANSTMAAVAAVPEPSTYALLAIAGLGLGGYVLRFRRS